MKPFDPTKPVQTRDGRKARIICTDREAGEFPIVALVTIDGRESITCYYADGKLIKNPLDLPGDLVNVPVKKWKWAYQGFNHHLYITEKHLTEEEYSRLILKHPGRKIIGRIMETEIEE